MGHKAMVGGTAYEVGGGRCMVGGTVYEIKKGRTLVGGTGYDVGFALEPTPVILTISGAGNASGCYVTIHSIDPIWDGKTFTAGTSGMTIYTGDTLSLYGSSMVGDDTISINGTTVKTGGGTYEYVIPEGITSVGVALSASMFATTISVTTNPTYTP